MPDVQPEPVSAEEIRVWWEGQTPDQRSAWQKRLPGLKGRDLIAGAWTQARGQ